MRYISCHAMPQHAFAVLVLLAQNSQTGYDTVELLSMPRGKLTLPVPNICCCCFNLFKIQTLHARLSLLLHLQSLVYFSKLEPRRDTHKLFSTHTLFSFRTLSLDCKALQLIKIAKMVRVLSTVAFLVGSLSAITTVQAVYQTFDLDTSVVPTFVDPIAGTSLVQSSSAETSCDAVDTCLGYICRE